MELRQLQYFVTVMEEASFTRAAERLHVAQPGVSAQIRQLEREIGEPLLDRSGRTVRATEAGLAMLPYAKAALDAVAGARLSVDELKGLVRGQVRVGTVAFLVSVDLPGMLAAFHQRHPEVAIAVSEGTPGALLEGLRTRELDLVLVGAPAAADCMTTQVIADEALVAICGPADPLAGHGAIALEALRDRELISFPRGAGLRVSVDAACAAAGFQPRIAVEAGDPRLLAEFAARHLGVALVPESVARAHAAAVAIVPVTKGPRAQIQLGWRLAGTAGPAARALIRHARATWPDLAPGLAPGLR